MTRDSTLDEFLGGESDDEGVDADAVDAEAAGDTDADVAPAAVTCEWTPGGAACEACGATVERRWTDGDARVCVNCKEW